MFIYVIYPQKGKYCQYNINANVMKQFIPLDHTTHEALNAMVACETYCLQVKLLI